MRIIADRSSVQDILQLHDPTARKTARHIAFVLHVFCALSLRNGCWDTLRGWHPMRGASRWYVFFVGSWCPLKRLGVPYDWGVMIISNSWPVSKDEGGHFQCAVSGILWREVYVPLLLPNIVSSSITEIFTSRFRAGWLSSQVDWKRPNIIPVNSLRRFVRRGARTTALFIERTIVAWLQW